MRRAILISVLLLSAIGFGVGWAIATRERVHTATPMCHDAGPDATCHIPVPNNRGPGVPDGFTGDVHPLLTRHAEMEVKAYWDCEKIPPNHLLPRLPANLDPVRRLYLSVAVDKPTKSYTERDFSKLLPPESVTVVGQPWALDPEVVAVFLKQFHPSASTHCVSVGRRAGPDGAFAILQGMSPAYLDIVFRIHAEFELAPKDPNFPAISVWYTPACFLGRVIVNRTAGTVEYFQLGVPTDIVKNIHGTVLTAPDLDHPDGYRIYQFLRAERMELAGGTLPTFEDAQWTQRMNPAVAHDKLAKLFYKFKDIDFVPFQQALATARAQKKPIFVFVALGALDDQSC